MIYGAQEDDRMKHPPSGEVEWLCCIKLPGNAMFNIKKQLIVKAKTWFDARAKACLALRAPELSDVIVELK